LRKWENEEEEQRPSPANRGLFEKFLNIFGFEAEIVEEDDELAAQSEYYSRDGKERGKLYSLTNSNKTLKMIIIEPTEFEEVQSIVDHLKNKRAVILNLEETDRTIARRIADFIGGAIYALEGTMQRVSGSIFLFTPAHIEVAVPVKPELKEKERERGLSSTNFPPSFYKTEKDPYKTDKER
jgi:cell division inhibitor SepF